MKRRCACFGLTTPILYDHVYKTDEEINRIVVVEETFLPIENLTDYLTSAIEYYDASAFNGSFSIPEEGTIRYQVDIYALQDDRTILNNDIEKFFDAMERVNSEDSLKKLVYNDEDYFWKSDSESWKCGEKNLIDEFGLESKYNGGQVELSINGVQPIVITLTFMS